MKCEKCKRPFERFTIRKSVQPIKRAVDNNRHFHYGTPYTKYGICKINHYTKMHTERTEWQACNICSFVAHEETKKDKNDIDSEKPILYRATNFRQIIPTDNRIKTPRRKPTRSKTPSRHQSAKERLKMKTVPTIIRNEFANLEQRMKAQFEEEIEQRVEQEVMRRMSDLTVITDRTSPSASTISFMSHELDCDEHNEHNDHDCSECANYTDVALFNHDVKRYSINNLSSITPPPPPSSEDEYNDEDSYETY